MGNVLVAFEFSGIVREAFAAMGHFAVSCDLLPTEIPGPHAQCDARPLLQEKWDLVICHPPCRYLANSGVQYMHKHPDRWARMEEAAELLLECLAANAPLVAVENPTPHGYAREIIGRPDFAVHPWQFGEPFSKRDLFLDKGPASVAVH